MTTTERPQAPSASPPRRRWPWLALVAAAGVAVTAVLGTGFGRDPSVVDSVLLDKPAPPLAGPTLDGGSFDLADHRGRVVVVNVWASWCDPCRREYPLLEQAARELGPRGVQIVGIDTQDTVEDAKAFLEQMGGENFPNVLDPDSRVALEWGVFGVPETFVVDRNGWLRAKHIGELSPGWIEAAVLPLLDRP
ncbi:MAG: redoxin domain-containing protein [Actinomycetota bacterium]|nr:redoxin domain-containing protein [Actinomycetota bacterium]